MKLAPFGNMVPSNVRSLVDEKQKEIVQKYVFSSPVLRLAFVDCPALSVPKLPVSS